MAATFISVGLNDFEKHFGMPHKKDETRRAFELIKPKGEEAYYRCILKSTAQGCMYLKVLTSVRSDCKVARDCGKDAIRMMVLWEDLDGWSSLISKTNRINRSGGEGSVAEDVILRTLEKARALAKESMRVPVCPRCDRAMVWRKTFWGCSGFTKGGCRNTLPGK